MKPTLDFERLYHLSRALHQQNAHEQMQTIVHTAAAWCGAVEACLVLFNTDGGVRSAFALLTENALEVWNPLIDRGLAGYAVHSQRSVVVRDIANDPRWVRLNGVPQKGAAVALPLMQAERVFGVLMLIHPRVDGFMAESLKTLDALAETASAALPAALEAIDARYQYGFKQAPVSMIYTDLNGTIHDANLAACAWLGLSRESLIGQPITATHRMMTEALNAHDMSQLTADDEIAFRAVLQTAPGELEPILLRARRVDIEGVPLVEFIAQDLSAENELEQLRNDLTAMIYHDLRNPLNTVKGALQRLSQVLANHESEAVRTMLQTGLRSTRQLKRMVDSLLDIQRLERGNRIITTRAVELRTMLAESVQSVQPLAIDSEINLCFQFDDSLPTLHMDDDMISRVVTNLLENAIKYTDAGGKVTLRAYANEREGVISVRDSGPGIPYHLQKKIFDKFTRVKYQDAPKGIGLGLAFCKLAVEAHGGQIWVESEPGSGSEFIFTLPVERQAMAALNGAD